MRFRSDKSSCRSLYPALPVSLTILGLIAPHAVASCLGLETRFEKDHLARATCDP
jgi:hypothetical protein